MQIRFPLGNDIFTEIRKNGDYYVDKTRFIEGLLKESFKVNLITRPRRFGKTLTIGKIIIMLLWWGCFLLPAIE